MIGRIADMGCIMAAVQPCGRRARLVRVEPQSSCPSGAAFSLQVLAEGEHDGAHRRAIILGTQARPWIYAETSIPDETLARHPWLARMGEVSLGETLASHGATRSAFAYARLMPDAPLVARAIAETGQAAQPLWVRHSEFAVQGATLTVQEVFLPAIGQAARPT